MTTKHFPRCLQLLLLLISLGVPAFAQTKIDLSQYRKDGVVAVVADSTDTLRLSWPTTKNLSAEIIFDLRDGQPLIRSIGISGLRGKIRSVVSQIDPVTTLTIGERH